jgi:cytochrome c oxidase subunit 2
MQALRRHLAALSTILATPFLAAQAALAQAPRDWEMGMQAAHSPVKVAIASLHDLVLTIITLVTLFVAGLLIWVAFRYNSKRNPVPGRFSHNTVIEVLWTVVPVLILVIIAIPSFRLVYFEDRTQNPDLTIKVTGHQWYWEYTYQDQGNLDFSSYIVPDDQLKPGQLRLLDVDNQLVVPAGKKIRVLTTSADVIHSFFIPSLGVQRYAIPGRLIETWFEVDKPGVYYGECNQICGENHSRMPISVHAVTPEEFTAWVAQAKTKFSANDVPTRVAAQGAPTRVPAEGAPTRVPAEGALTRVAANEIAH